MVAALTNGPAAGVATTSDCAELPVPQEESLGFCEVWGGGIFPECFWGLFWMCLEFLEFLMGLGLVGKEARDDHCFKVWMWM